MSAFRRHVIVHVPTWAIVCAVTIVAVITSFAISSLVTGNTKVITPSFCSGDWLFPERAVEESANIDLGFSDDSSAILIAPGQKLFCAFGRSQPDVDSLVSQAVLAITVDFERDSWLEPDTVANTETEQLETASSSSPTLGEDETVSTTTPFDESISSSTEEALVPDTGTIFESETLVDTPSPELSPESNEVSIEAADTPTEAPPADLIPEAPTEPAPLLESMIPWLFSISHAQILESEEIPTGESSTTEAVAPATDITPITGAIEAIPEFTTLRVTYTIDGVTWNDLGFITESGTHNFDLPVTKESEMLGLVVRVEPDKFLPDDRAFVDSMSLTLTYDSAVVDDQLIGMAAIDTSMPNILTSTFESFRGISESAVFIASTEAGRALFTVGINSEGAVAKRIAAGEYLKTDSPLGIKGGRIFWLTTDDAVMSYRIEDGAYFKTPLIQERESFVAEFDGFPWAIAFRNNEFLFSTPETGEVGGDNDGSVAEQFRAIFIGPLIREDLVRLGLVVEEVIDDASAFENHEE